MLSGKLTQANHIDLLKCAAGKSKRELEVMLTELHPAAQVKPAGAVIRAVPVLMPSACVQNVQAPPGQTTASRAGDETSAIGGAKTCGAAAPVMTAVAGTTTAAAKQGDPSATKAASLLPSNDFPVAEEPATLTTAAAFRLHVTLDPHAYALLRQAQDLLSHRFASGDVAKVIEVALQNLITQLQGKKHAQLKKDMPSAQARSGAPTLASPGMQDAAVAAMSPAPSEASDTTADLHTAAASITTCQAVIPRTVPKQAAPLDVAAKTAPREVSRNIPRRIKRAAFCRDNGRCTYTAPNGTACGSTSRLEYHHLHPFARGGTHTVSNLTLHCRAHNTYAALLDFGASHNMPWRRSEQSGRSTKRAQPKPTTRQTLAGGLSEGRRNS